jgi:DNA-binding NarL/FixJ family response regulator
VIRTIVIGVDEQLRTFQVSLLSGEPDIDVLFAFDPSTPAGTPPGSAVPDVVVADQPDTVLLLCRAAGVGRLPQWRGLPVVVTGGPRETAARGQPSGAGHPAGLSRVAQGFATLAPAVRAAAAGHRVLPLCSDRPGLSGPVAAGSAACSPREREVLGILAHGATNREIADLLRISETTVRSHVQSLRGKLKARSRAELVARAFERGLAQVASA